MSSDGAYASVRHAATWVALTGFALLTGCASPVRETAPDATHAPPGASTQACLPPDGPVPRPEFCTLPMDVRTFVRDRDLCDHFRGEPWPEGDDAESRERRHFILQNVRTLCAGSDRELEALLQRHREDATVMRVLSQFERGIETP